MSQMSAHIFVGAFALVCGSVCAMTSSFTVFHMVDKVNERLPEERQFAHLGWYWSKYERLFAEYKRLYPDGSLLRRFRVLAVLVFVCFFICAWGFGIFSR
jgi:hypothetical protein